MDVHLLASDLKDGVGLLTADVRLDGIAKELGLA